MVVSFPLTELTASQRQTYQTYIEARRESDRALKEPLWFALVLTREKPALLMVPDFTPPATDSWDPLGECELLEQVVPPDKEITMTSHKDDSPEPPITIEALATAFELEWQAFRGSMCVARTSWLLDLLPTSMGSASYHWRLGTIFGYPQAAIEYFLSAETRAQAAAIEATAHFQPEELAYTTFLPYVHDESIEGYERAIAIGQAMRTTIATLAHQWELPGLETLAADIYERAVTEYHS